jgi:outer membrane protein OmpU
MNIKKIGLTALAGSLVAATSYAGEMSVAGSASVAVEHINNDSGNAGKSWSMGNQLTFTGGGELDNGLNVSLSFVLDQGDDASNADGTAKQSNAGTPFDSHSVSISSDALGTLTFHGEGGSSATTAVDATAAGDIWDQFDDEEGLEPTGVGSGDNMLFYTTPSLMEGLSLSASYLPHTTGTDGARVGYSATYTGVEGLSVTYATGEGTDPADATVLKASYAYGPVTVSYSDYEYDTTGATSDDDVTSYKVSYTVSDELSVSYGAEEIETNTSDSEYDMISASYTAGGMTLTASFSDATDIAGTAATTENRERWAISASFAF